MDDRLAHLAPVVRAGRVHEADPALRAEESQHRHATVVAESTVASCGSGASPVPCSASQSAQRTSAAGTTFVAVVLTPETVPAVAVGQTMPLDAYFDRSCVPA